MLKVPGPVGPPGICPITGRANDPDGFIDTGSVIPGFDPRLCVSLSGVRQMAQTAGLPTVNEHEQVCHQLAEALEVNAALASERDELQAFKDSVDTIVSLDYVSRKKPGRKPAERVAA